MQVYCCAPVQALVSHLAVPPGWPGAPLASAWLRSAAPRLPCPSRRRGCCGANANSTLNCPTVPHQIPCRFYTPGGHELASVRESVHGFDKRGVSTGLHPATLQLIYTRNCTVKRSVTLYVRASHCVYQGASASLPGNFVKTMFEA